MVLLHLVLLLLLRAQMQGASLRDDRVQSRLSIVFDETAVAAPARVEAEYRAAPVSTPRLSPGGAPAQPVKAPATVPPEAAPSAVEPPFSTTQLYHPDGSVRLPDAIDSDQFPRSKTPWERQQVDAQRLFGRQSPIPFESTRFEKAWVPQDLDALGEACWRNAWLGTVLSMISIPACQPKRHGGPRDSM